MLDSIKKLILSNKYSLLVLLILSLWLRLAKDYSIILSYIVLLIMYLAIGMVVSYVLEIFESKKSVSDSADESEAKRASVSAAKKREVIGHKELQRHSEKARVTSSYVKNAEGMSSSMSRRLEKTAATFNSIKGDSDKFAEEEKKQSSLYGNTRKILFENPEELYKNKNSLNIPDDDEAGELYLYTCELLKSAGITEKTVFCDAYRHGYSVADQNFSVIEEKEHYNRRDKCGGYYTAKRTRGVKQRLFVVGSRALVL